MTVCLTKTEARRFLVNYHGLGASARFKGKEGILEYLEQVGAIQFDPLNVVGRNPDLVLQSRIPNYKRSVLDELLYKDRKLVDHFDKQMSIHLAREWPHRKRIREHHAKCTVSWLAHRKSEAALERLDEVFEALRAKGQALSTQLDFGSVENPWSWGSNKVAGAALDYLWAEGRVGIHGRRNTQKIYAEITQLFPKELVEAGEPFADFHDFMLWYVKRRVDAVGLAADRNAGTWLCHFAGDSAGRTPVLNELAEEGRLLKVKVEGVKDTLFMPPEALGVLDMPEAKSKKMRFLAPLDNLIFDRKLIEQLFTFSYGWEVYTPVAKRKYGYYVLPVLYGDELVGRFEPENHRGGDLVIKNWWWEPGVKETAKLKNAVRSATRCFQNYLKT